MIYNKKFYKKYNKSYIIRYNIDYNVFFNDSNIITYHSNYKKTYCTFNIKFFYIK